MDPSEFQTLVKRRSAELARYYHRTLPVKAGTKVKSIVQQNFRLGDSRTGPCRSGRKPNASRPAPERTAAGGR